MRVAVIADVHANLPALEAVLDAVARQRVDRLVCVGDLVGYNAEPLACINALRKEVDVFVAGNHDVDVVRMGATPGTSALARDVQAWTREQLDGDALAFLASQPAFVADPSGFAAAHGCFLNNTYYSGYVTSTMLEKNLKTIQTRADWPKVALCGHTHIPMIGWLDRDFVVEAGTTSPATWPDTAGAVLINPGSVGQPRDGDPRASFAIIDMDRKTVAFERVSYDVDRACRAISAARLPEFLAERLREGR